LQEAFKALPEAGEHPGSKPALTFVVLLPPQAHASASEIAKDFFMMNLRIECGARGAAKVGKAHRFN
jgi:hypothetical protein